MKVKIRNCIHDSGKEPIMIILTDTDKFNISHMAIEMHNYCCYPSSMLEDEAKKFMGKEK